ncbi:MAG: polyhydroxyalkanoate synthesis regulator DNA-binding domain-containing protein [Myxococcales bacterium]
MDTNPEVPTPPSAERARRVIKRYSNRKLYDTKDSRYVTLLQIAEMVRTGEEVQIIDNNSKEDLTEVTLAQIIYEEQKAHARSVPLQTLKELIHTRTEKVLEGLREGPIGRLIPGGAKDKPLEAKAEDDPKKPTLVDQAKEKFEDIQNQVDERIQAFWGNFRPFEQLQTEVKRLAERIEELERRLKGTAQSPDETKASSKKDGASPS